MAVVTALCAFVLVPPALSGDSAGDEFFEKEVRPILVARCVSCHGNAKPKGGLRLTSRENILKGGDSGPSAVAGKPEESLLVDAIRYEDDPKMPPKKKLADREIATLTRWVAAGLPWPEASAQLVSTVEAPRTEPVQFTDAQRQFWSFQPVKEVAPPAVHDASWPRSDIDRFLLAALESRGLKPAPPADKRTLIRRATFDLTGLPPSPEEIDAFLQDDSPSAFAKVVDRLLASPRYGERWGRHWLDIVRYADSRDARGIGGSDDITEAWRYRDWVVKAFNDDLPYDQFIINQIAGDLLPAPVPDAVNADGLVATGLLTIGEWGTGDADKEKMMTDIVDDQIDVVGRAFLGLTIACARCHDHKFDPILQADYYGLAGIFFSTHILPEPGVKTGGSPLLRTPIVPKAAIDAVAQHKERVLNLETEIKALAEAHYRTLSQKLVADTSRYLLASWDYTHLAEGQGKRSLTEFAAEHQLHAFALRRWLSVLGLDAGRVLSRTERNVGGKAGVFAWKGEADCPNLTLNTTDQDQAILTFHLAPQSVSVHPGPQSGVAVRWTSPIDGTVQISGRVIDADAAGGDGIAWQLQHRASSPHELAAGQIMNGASQRLANAENRARLAAVPVRAGESIELVILPKAEYTCDTTTLELAIATTDGVAVWDLTQDLLANPELGNPHADRLGNAEVWQVVDASTPSQPGPEAVWAAWNDAVRKAAAGQADRSALEAAANELQKSLDRARPSGADTSPAIELLKALTSPEGPYWIPGPADERLIAPEAHAILTDRRAELDRLKQNPPPPVPLALAAQEGGVPKSEHEGFGDARIHIRGNYMQLGDKVPRHFPRILAGDEPPAIPQGSGRLELARWIARPEHPLTARVMVNRLWQYHFGEGLVRTPGNFGKLGEKSTHPELLDWLAKQFVASGWSIKTMHRAIMLSAAYQQASEASPESLRLDSDNRLFSRMNRHRLEAEALRDSLLSVSGRLELSMGGPAYRELETPRSTLYLMTIRSDRSSFGPLFDAADSTAMVDRRTISTVAPQALFLLNHPFALEQAKVLAKRVIEWKAEDDKVRIERLYILLYGRPASTEETEIGLKAVTRDGVRSRAWEAYCQVLVCANEFLYID
jgi:cytochrome c553